MIRICFVCLGNICRSPTAEGIMQHLVAQYDLGHAIALDSAGTSAWHEGEKADARSREVASQRGVPLTSRSRQFKAKDFSNFEYVVAMDQSNLKNLSAMAGPDDASKLVMLRAFDPRSPEGPDVPDPYYGGPSGFDDVYDICQAACEGFLAHLQRHHELG